MGTEKQLYYSDLMEGLQTMEIQLGEMNTKFENHVTGCMAAREALGFKITTTTVMLVILTSLVALLTAVVVTLALYVGTRPGAYNPAPIITSLDLEPSLGPTMPSSSSWSIRRAARG